MLERVASRCATKFLSTSDCGSGFVARCSILAQMVKSWSYYVVYLVDLAYSLLALLGEYLLEGEDLPDAMCNNLFALFSSQTKLDFCSMDRGRSYGVTADVACVEWLCFSCLHSKFCRGSERRSCHS